MTQEKAPSINVLGDALQLCSTDPVTGFFRDGCCDTGPLDHGQHTVCAIMTDDFLAMSKFGRASGLYSLFHCISGLIRMAEENA